MRYKRLTWADDQSSAAPQSIFDVTALEILLPSKRQIFRQTLPNDGFQQRCVECWSEDSICLRTKEFQGSPHSMKSRRRPLPVCPFGAVTSSHPGRFFYDWMLAFVERGCANRSGTSIWTSGIGPSSRNGDVLSLLIQVCWAKSARNSHSLMSHQFTYDTNKNQIGERSQLRSGYWTHAALTNSLCFMNECTGSDKELPSACTKKYLWVVFFFFFQRWSQSFKLLMRNEIIKDNMSKLPVLKRSWNFYEHHPAFLKPDVGSQAFSVAHFSDSINKICRSHGCA